MCFSDKDRASIEASVTVVRHFLPSFQNQKSQWSSTATELSASNIYAPCLTAAAEPDNEIQCRKGKLVLWENRSAAVPSLNRSSWDQNIVRIFEYPSLSNMWGFLTVFQIIWDTRDCAAWGEDHIWLDRLPMPGSRGLLYANANTHTRVPNTPISMACTYFQDPQIHKYLDW